MARSGQLIGRAGLIQALDLLEISRAALSFSYPTHHAHRSIR